MKRELLLVVLLCMAGFLFAQNTPLCGDANADNSVDITDALFVAFSYTIPDFDLDLQAADVNRDKKVDIVDALLIARFYVGLIDNLNCQETQTNDITGKWNLHCKTIINLKEDEYTYDFGSGHWTSEVWLFPNPIMLSLPTSLTEEYSTGMYSLKMHSEEGIFPYYEISIEYVNWPYHLLRNANLRIMDNNTTYSDFSFSSSGLDTQISVDKKYIGISQLGLKNKDNSEIRYMDLNCELDQTALLEAGIEHTFNYDSYDALMNINIIDDSSWNGQILDGDMILTIKGSYTRNGPHIIIDIPEMDRPLVESPVILEAVTENDGSLYLYRQVKKEPSLSVIAAYYGITDSNIASCDYIQRFEKYR